MQAIVTGKLNHFVLFLLGSACSPALQAQLPADSIRQLIKQEVDSRRGSSIVVGLINAKGEKQVIGYGKVNDNTGRQPDGNTVYEIGSVTKVFTSLILEEMARENKLHLTDPIGAWLPDSVATPSRNRKQITLLDLSCQISGLPRLPNNFFPKDMANPYADYTVKQLYYFISHYRLTRDPGAQYEYSNIGAGLLGYILTLAAKQDYETLVKRVICAPLHMQNTVITLTPALAAAMATGHDVYGTPVKNWDFPILPGMGALRSTTNDMLIFLAANLALVKTSLAPAIAVTHIACDSTGIPGLEIAMGWHILTRYGRKITWHNGGTGGFRSFIGFDPVAKTGVVVLINSANSVDDIATHILDPRYPVQPFVYKEPPAIKK